MGKSGNIFYQLGNKCLDLGYATYGTLKQYFSTAGHVSFAGKRSTLPCIQTKKL